jgi:hypothetical protein
MKWMRRLAPKTSSLGGIGSELMKWVRRLPSSTWTALPETKGTTSQRFPEERKTSLRVGG